MAAFECTSAVNRKVKADDDDLSFYNDDDSNDNPDYDSEDDC